MNVFEKPASSQTFIKFEDDLRELLPRLSSTVGKIIAVGEKVIGIDSDDDFSTLKDVIDQNLPGTEPRLKMVVLIVLYCAYQVHFLYINTES